jgi:phage terminase large subunit-like protein
MRYTARTLAIVVILSMLLIPLAVCSGTAICADDLLPWSRIADGGLGNANNWHMASGPIFQGRLIIYSSPFVGLGGGGPASMYTYDGAVFEQVGVDGLGNNNNDGLHPTVVYEGKLYIGTANGVDGGELYEWDGVGAPAKIINAGWGEGPGNDTVIPLGVLEDKLIVSVSNRTGPGTGGIRIYSYDGNTWEQLVGPAGTILPSGFADFDNEAAGFADILNGKMYIPAVNLTTGLQVWSFDGAAFQLAGNPAPNWGVQQMGGAISTSVPGGVFYLGTTSQVTGGQLWSYNGSNWTKLEDGGIDSNNNRGLIPFARGRDLYVGTLNQNGCQLYMRKSGVMVKIAKTGFDGTNNNWGSMLTAYGGELVACTANNNGGEVWTTRTLSTTWYFAEGTTRTNPTDGEFEEWLCLQNPNSQAAKARMTYMLGDGSTKIQDVTVAKQSRKTVSVNDFLGADKDVSTLVTSDIPILAERPMYFNYHNKWTDGHIVLGAGSPRAKWYFAEGTTRDNVYDGTYEEWLCLQNPTGIDADVTITYMLGTGQNIVKNYLVEKTSRRTVDVNLDVGKDQDVSMVVESTQAIVAERPMYFLYRNKWKGGHNVVGAAAPAKTFYFAEGTTRDNTTDGSFEEWICIQNPNKAEADVDITYWTDQEGTRTQSVKVGPLSRSTVDVKLEIGPDVDTAFKLVSDVPILVERPMYFDYHGVRAGGHNVMGCDKPRRSFYFAEGTTIEGFDTYVAVLNPQTAAANVRFTFMIEGEANKTLDVQIASSKRETINIAPTTGAGKNVSIKVTSDRPIVAERPMYFNYQGWCTGGHNTLGYGI